MERRADRPHLFFAHEWAPCPKCQTGVEGRVVFRDGRVIRLSLCPRVLEGGVSANLPPARLEEFLRHCALGRPGTFEEAAEVAAFLVSDRNSYMNGATVVLDGAV